jgi:hypothetical protein
MKPEQFIITNGGDELGSNAKDIYEQLLNKGMFVTAALGIFPAMFASRWEPNQKTRPLFRS